jgi:exoribonuclease R
MPAVKKALTLLTKYAKMLQQKRIDKGALELKSLDELHFDLDDKKQPVKIEAHQDLEINEVVAEWMIYANHVSVYR